MFKTVNEAMTAICNAIRSYNNTSDKLNLDEIPQEITNVHSNGWIENEKLVVDELEAPVQKIEGYIGEECSVVDSVGRIRFIDEQIPKVYESGRNNKQTEWDESDALISEKLDNILAEQETIIAEQEGYFGSEVEIPTDPDIRDEIVVDPDDGGFDSEFDW
jgi:hypothetical protein